MGNNAGVGGNVISLPSGGGAQKGMGEKFSPDLFTGTGNFSVPIALPPGRNGFQPEITLVYSTGNGNSPFGLGWGLSVPGVSRKTSKGVPVYDDKKDTFLLSGAEDLVPVPGAPAGAQRYRPRTEGLFARIDHYHDRDNDYWKVWSKDGLISWYGTPNSKGYDEITKLPNDPAVVADPDYLTSGRPKVYEWKLTKTQDPFGNIIQYTYKRDTKNTDHAHHWDMLYLEKIEYVDYGIDPVNFMVKVTFEYETRPDPFSFYKAGFELRTVQRCKSIKTETWQENLSPSPNFGLTKTYHLHYNQKVSGVVGNVPQYADIELPLNGTSLLTQVEIEGHDGLASEKMPPLAFTYTTFEPKKRDFYPLEGRDLPSYSLGNQDYELVDMFGNGLPDIVQMNGVARYWKNLGGGKYDMPRMMKEAPAGVQLADPEVSMMDTNGDGKIDLVVNKPGISGFFPMQHDGLWDKKSFRSFGKTPSFSLADPEVKLIDLDGDGITDALRNGARFECFYQDPEKGFYKVQTVEKKRLNNFPNVSFADPRVRFADMTGDGMQDIVLIHDGNVEYWPYMGHGKWGARVQMLHNPRYPYQYDPKRILLGDVDGDGLADIIYVDNNTVTLWVNQGGNKWSEPVVIDGTPPVYDTASVRLADMLGSGIAGVVWSYDFDRLTKDRLYLLDFTGGYKPYLLHEMDNQMGAVTRVEYKPSTYYYICDQNGLDAFATPSNSPDGGGQLPSQLGRGGGWGRRSQQTPLDLPTARTRKPTPWKTTLPFPVQVVSKVEVIDQLSLGKLVTKYAYSHGYWDGGEREFRGFGSVRQRDTETFDRYNDTLLQTKNGYTETKKSPFGGGTSTAGGRGEDFLPITESTYYSAPTETRTWFHLGPIGEGVGDWKEVEFSDEYWAEDPSVLQQPATMRALVKALPRRAKRDAYRSLRGSMLRSELYALDGTARQHRPYTVTENLYGIRKEFEPTTLNVELQTLNSGYIFFPHSLASRSSQWERGEEPMTSFSFTDDYEQYGLPRTQIAVAVPRRRNFLTGTGGIEEEVYLATASRTKYVHNANEDGDEDTHRYLIGRAIDAKAYEITNEGIGSVFALKDAVQIALANTTFAPNSENPVSISADYSLKLLSHSLTYYDGEEGDEFVGNEDQTLGNYGVAVRTETLVMTDAQVTSAYGSERPPYLIASSSPGTPSWTGDYPADFRTALPANAGYEYKDGTGEYLEGYYCKAERKKFDFHNGSGVQKGLVQQMMDPLGNTASVEYDDYYFLPTYVTDPSGLTTAAQYDYRTLQAKQVTDPNGNKTVFDFSPLGFLRASALIGQGTEGDYKAPSGTFAARYEASSKLEYDFLSFLKTGEPVFVRTIKRENHYADGINDNTIISVEYSDGFGRLLQSRAQAEETIFGNQTFGESGLDEAGGTDGSAVGSQNLNRNPQYLNVVVSGWQVYNNKGKVVEKYEPFYDTGFDFVLPVDGGVGQKVKMFYDPRGQVIRTLNPDNTEQRVLFGIPLGLENPDVYTPTPWESYTYDANDLADIYSPPEGGVPEGGGGVVPTTHYNTPSSSVIDALGRTIKTIDRLTSSESEVPQVVMQYQYDIRGNLLKVFDAYNRTVFDHTYDLANRPLKTMHLDAGTKRVVYDCMGKPVEMRDLKGSLVLNTYDILNRPTYVWARDKAGETLGLRQVMTYGNLEEPLTVPNGYGKPIVHLDEAGSTAFMAYDFKGNLLSKFRRVVSDEAILETFDSAWTDLVAFRLDWGNQPANLYDPNVYQTDMAYDALNRVTQMTYPEDVDGGRKVLLPAYNKGGAMESVAMKNTVSDTNSIVSVERIAYNAKGQRILIAYGNGIMTRYRYDEVNFRLTRMKSEKYTKTGLSYASNGDIRQNYAYTYDLAGNITSIKDTTIGCGYGATPNELERKFTYDPLYRLLTADGRESDEVLPPEWDETYYPQDTTAKRYYKQTYAYDKMGNIQSLSHAASTAFTRNFNYESGKNKLSNILVGSNTYSFDHDVNGNILSDDGGSRHMEYDYADRLKSFRIQPGTAEPSQYAHYIYDAGGNRVKKLVRKQGGKYISTTYIDGIFEQTKDNATGIPNLIIGNFRIGDSADSNAGYQNILHLMDGNSRMATYRMGDDFGDTKPAIQYNLEDHLGSSNLALDESGSLISSEEYYPFGETSFGSYGKKRYRFCGKEKDGESGLYYYGMRYYSAWTCRFVSVDPLAGKYPFYTPYQYAGNKPIISVDIDGLEGSNDTGQQANKGATPPAGVKNTGVEINSDNLTSKQTIFTPPVKKGVMGNSYAGYDSNGKITESKPNAINIIKSWFSSKGGETTAKKPNSIPKTSANSETFEKFYKTLSKHEGGYKNDPEHDSGDPTNRGITTPTFEQHAQKILGIEPTHENLKNLTSDQAKLIYKAQYWDKIKADKIVDSQFAAQFADLYVNSGTNAIKVLQKTLNELGYDVKVDKKMGNTTLSQLNKALFDDPEKAFNTFKELRIEFYEGLVDKNPSKFGVYLNGWKNRANSFVYKHQTINLEIH